MVDLASVVRVIMGLQLRATHGIWGVGAAWVDLYFHVAAGTVVRVVVEVAV